jgi:hypothetical protein
MQLKEGVHLRPSPEAKKLAHLFHCQPTISVCPRYGLFQQSATSIGACWHDVFDELVRYF